MSLPRFRRACASAVASTVLLGGLGLGAAQPATAAEGRDPALWPFAVDSPWNMPIGSGARLSSADDPRVATLVRGGSRVNANEGYSHPVYQASTSDPEAIIEDVSVPGRSRKTRVPVGASPATGSDGHLHVISPDKQHVHETWIAARRSDTHLTARRVERNDLAGSGILQGGTRAYGGSAIGGLVRRWEMDQRSIRHAVAVAMDPAQLRSGAVWPANADDGGYPPGGTVPMGTLFAIPGDVNLAALDLNPEARAVARALQDYGAYVVDQGAPFVVYMEQGVTGAQQQQVERQLEPLKNLLRVVTNNGPSSVGGGGTPRVPLAPPIGAGSAAPPVTATPVVATGPARGNDMACPAATMPPTAFVDLVGSMHASGARCVTWWGVADGRSRDRFDPASSVTRGQMASFVARLIERSGGDLPAAPANAFRDDQGSVHERSIDQLAELGVLKGRTDGTFAPGAVVSRAEMATFLVRAHEQRSGAGLGDGGNRFSDDDGSPHEANIDRLAASGLAEGVAVARFAPGAPVQRGQAATFLARTLDLLVESGTTVGR